MKKSCTKMEARRYMETAIGNLHHMIALTLSPSEDRDKLMQKFREMCGLIPAALDASEHYEVI